MQTKKRTSGSEIKYFLLGAILVVIVAGALPTLADTIQQEGMPTEEMSQIRNAPAPEQVKFGPTQEQINQANMACKGGPVEWNGTTYTCAQLPQQNFGPQNCGPDGCAGGPNFGGFGNGGNGNQNFGPQNCGPDGCAGVMNSRDQERMAKEFQNEKKRFKTDMGQVQTVRMIKSLIKKLPAGYSASQDILDALAKVDSINQQADAAEDNETLNGLRNDLQDAMNTLQQGEQQLRMIGELKRMDKQASSELNKLSKKLSSIETKLRKSGIDAGEMIQAAHDAVNTATENLQKARDSARNGNIEDAQSGYQDFFEGLGETWQSVGALEAIQGITKGIGSIEKNVKSGKAKIAKLIKQNPDVDFSDVEDLVQQATDKLDELKSAVKSRDFAPEDAMSIFMDLDDLRRQIEDGLSEVLDGKNVDLQFFSAGNMGKMPMMNFGGPGGPQNGGMGDGRGGF